MLPDPFGAKLDLAELKVLVGGKPVPDVYQVTQVRVHKAVNRIASAKIVLLDGNPSTESFDISEADTLVPGKEIEVTVGYHGDKSSIFKGIIVKHGIRVANGRSTLVLTCFGKAVKMTQGRSSAYVGKTDSAVFSDLIDAAGLQAEVSATTAVPDGLVKFYATDWDFMVCRAEINGQLVIADGDTVKVAAPALDAEPVLRVGYGGAISSLDAEVDARSQLASVTCSAWDFTTQQVAQGSSTEPTVNDQGDLDGKTLSNVLGRPAWQMQSSAPIGAAQLKNWADAQLLKSRLARLRGKVAFPGNALVHPGDMVELSGLGARFNGKAFVSSVTHTVEPGSWNTEVGFGLESAWFTETRSDIVAPAASGLAPGVAGLHIGKVKQIDQDPDGQTRVLVDVPVIGMEGEGIWARLATGYATTNGGIFFVPELEDEVVLGFLNEDPGFPIVLGSLYSSQRTPPFTADAPNTNKGIVTKAQLKISMDDVQKVLTIRTPGGHVVTLSDADTSVTIEDSNKNKVQLSASGILLDSPSDITIKAGGSINITATASLDMKGLDVGVTATTGALTANGAAGATLKSDAEVTVKAPMVLIN
jgi:Rhs element Vgr protein